ncbi:MAG: hypothetical protein AAF684_08130, partial [Pseudomonadota bacterium]
PAETLADQIMRPDGPPTDTQTAAALAQVADAAPDLSVFERETLTAFLLMADAPHDLALVEVGMGGDDDATNVLPDSAAAAITPVALDHQAFLGTDVATIARRKAGIAKPGRPLVLAAQDVAAEGAIVGVATDLGAGPILRRGGEWDVERVGDGLRVTLGGRSIAAPRPALRGQHQIDNAGLALATLIAAGVAFDPAALASAFFPKRMQAVDPADFGFPAHWRAFRDGAHNPHAAAALARAIEDERRPGERIALFIHLRGDKDAAGFAAALAHLNADIDPPTDDAASAQPTLAVVCGTLQAVKRPSRSIP